MLSGTLLVLSWSSWKIGRLTLYLWYLELWLSQSRTNLLTKNCFLCLLSPCMAPLSSWKVLCGPLWSLPLAKPRNTATSAVQKREGTWDTNPTRLEVYFSIWKVQGCFRCTFPATRKDQKFPTEEQWASGQSYSENRYTPAESHFDDVFQTMSTFRTISREDEEFCDQYEKSSDPFHGDSSFCTTAAHSLYPKDCFVWAFRMNINQYPLQITSNFKDC